MDDLPILEMELGQRATDLRPQLEAVDRRKLAEEAYPRVDLAQKRLAHRHARQGHWHRCSLAALAVGEADPEEYRERDHHRPCHPGPPPGSPRGGTFSPLGVRPIRDFVHLATPLIPNSPFAARGEGMASYTRRRLRSFIWPTRRAQARAMRRLPTRPIALCCIVAACDIGVTVR